VADRPAVAVANVSAQAGTVGVILRNDAGAQIGTGSIAMQPNGHKSFVLSDPTAGFPVTANIRGTIEFDTPAGGQISVLGIRTTPLGTSNTLTTIPALANVGTPAGASPTSRPATAGRRRSSSSTPVRRQHR
jgi:hypothetical protein